MLSNISSIALRSGAGRSLLAKTALRSASVVANTTPTAARVSPLVAVPTTSLTAKRQFSSDSHDDFAPKKKTVEGADEAIEMIKNHITSNPVMLYMKGNPSMPMCGFSATVVGILQKEGVDFSSVNVLDYPDIREGVKKYA